MYKPNENLNDCFVIMDDEIRNRAKKIIAWLKDERIILSQKDAAEKMQYNPCVVSTIMSGNGKISDRFVRKLCSLSPKLNVDWLLRGEGEMIVNDSSDTSAVEPEQSNPFSLDKESLVRIIEGQTKVINFVMDYLQKIEIENRQIRDELKKLRSEIKELEKA